MNCSGEIKKYDLRFVSPLGLIGVILDQHAVAVLDFLITGREDIPEDKFAREIVAAIRNYFIAPNTLWELPISLHGTAFQMQVWAKLQTIPPGTIISYGKLAQLLDTGARAIGGACHANPLPIIIPCHRVVGKTHLGGYSGRPDIKKWLLQHEGLLIDEMSRKGKCRN